MGAPLFEARRTVVAHGVAVYSSNYALYGDMSQRVMEALRVLADEVEVYSIDEAFVGLAGGDGGSDVRSSGLAIREKVLKWTGIPTSIGVAPTKTLAKVANHLAKRENEHRGVLDLSAPANAWGLWSARRSKRSGASGPRTRSCSRPPGLRPP